MKKQTASHAEFFRHVSATIAKRQRQVLGVTGSKTEPAFAYTIGNQAKGLPELLLIGNFDEVVMAAVLNKLSDMMLTTGKPFDNGSLVNLGGTDSVCVWDALPTVHEQYTVQAGQFYGTEDYRVQQVVVPDRKGRWPGDPLCHKGWRVPVFKLLKLDS